MNIRVCDDFPECNIKVMLNMNLVIHVFAHSVRSASKMVKQSSVMTCSVDQGLTIVTTIEIGKKKGNGIKVLIRFNCIIFSYTRDDITWSAVTSSSRP